MKNLIHLLRIPILLFFAIFVLGCTHLPDAKINYYLTKSVLKVDISRSFLCKTKNSDPISVATVLPSITHVADLTTEPVRIDVAGLRRWFTDTDLTFEFYDDNRLKSVNAISTGQGATVIESASKLVSSERNLLAAADTPKDISICEHIVGHAKGLKENIFKLEYSDQIDLDKISEDYVSQVIKTKTLEKWNFDFVCAYRRKINSLKPVLNSLPPVTEPSLVIREPGQAILIVKVEPNLTADGKCPKYENSQGTEISRDILRISQYGDIQNISLPKPKLFGNSQFGLSLSEGGQITSIRFVRGTAGAQVVNSIGNIRGATSGRSQRALADALKAKADLIKEYNRVAKCRLKPAECE